MRLIDADALIDCFEMRGDSDLGWHLYEVIDEINDAPTAYDVDEVVEELETEAVCYDSAFDCWGKCEHCNNSAINRKEAIDIVKRGGVE